MTLFNLPSKLFIGLCIVVAGCGKSSTSIQVLQPADITLPDHIQKVVIMNRTYPEKGSKAWNIMEGILTGEGIGTDRRASEDCLSGLVDIMKQSPRFQLVRPPLKNMEGTGTGQFPTPLQWGIIENLCNLQQADALILLEAFDSDSRMDFTPGTRTARSPEGTNVEIPTVNANMRMNITNGWRIYDPKTKQIIDENRSDDFLNFGGSGDNQAQAVSKMPSRMEALSKVGYHAGQRYGRRISPMWINVSRMYYKKGNGWMEQAARKAETRDWKGAAEMWKKEALNTDKTIAGRACYNMAVASEVEGKLDIAVKWAQDSYAKFGNKKARSYANVLQQRIQDNEKVKFQMRSMEQK